MWTERCIIYERTTVVWNFRFLSDDSIGFSVFIMIKQVRWNLKLFFIFFFNFSHNDDYNIIIHVVCLCRDVLHNLCAFFGFCLVYECNLPAPARLPHNFVFTGGEEKIARQLTDNQYIGSCRSSCSCAHMWEMSPNAANLPSAGWFTDGSVFLLARCSAAVSNCPKVSKSQTVLE